MEIDGKRLQAILGHVRRADKDFSLIEDGDKIAVGLSGGKDSLTLLAALRKYQLFHKNKTAGGSETAAGEIPTTGGDYPLPERSPARFNLIAITIDCTGGQTDFSHLEKFCADLGVEYRVEPSQIFDVIFNVRHEKSPCSLCSKMRRGLLVSVAKEMGCNKIALGHHADDLIETFLLCLTHEGRVSTFQAKSFLDRTGVTMIRPLIYAKESETIAASKGFPILKNPCPANGNTRREYMKQLVKKIDSDVPNARDRMTTAVSAWLRGGAEAEPPKENS
jgi:tRNA(Ile)-lysidine synthase TilS/MesJ